MVERAKASRKVALTRRALRRRVLQWYGRFNRGRWNDCFSLVDPRLTNKKVDLDAYTASLRRFKDRYGSIHPWHVRISLHVDDRQASDSRPFAYVYVVWQDERREFHMFRERWIREHDEWYTRVAGLVAGEAEGN